MAQMTTDDTAILTVKPKSSKGNPATVTNVDFSTTNPEVLAVTKTDALTANVAPLKGGVAQIIVVVTSEAGTFQKVLDVEVKLPPAVDADVVLTNN